MKGTQSELSDEALKLAECIGVAAAARELSLYESQLYAWRSKQLQQLTWSERENDLALRAMSTEHLDPGLVARPLMNVPFHLVASPTYLERVGRPTTLRDLNGHALLMYGGINFSGNLPLKGRNVEDAVTLRTVMRSENETMLHLAAQEGMGLIFLPEWMTRADIFQ